MGENASLRFPGFLSLRLFQKKNFGDKKVFSEDLFDTSFEDDTRNRFDETLQVRKFE